MEFISEILYFFAGLAALIIIVGVVLGIIALAITFPLPVIAIAVLLLLMRG